MKAGRLFESALKQARIDLRPGAEMQVKVKGRGERLQLVVSPAGISEFEASILERSQKVSLEGLKRYSPKMPVGQRIRALRKASELTLEALASKAGLTKGSLGSIEKGDRSVGLMVLKKIAKALGIPVRLLID